MFSEPNMQGSRAEDLVYDIRGANADTGYYYQGNHGDRLADAVADVQGKEHANLYKNLHGNRADEHGEFPMAGTLTNEQKKK